MTLISTGSDSFGIPTQKLDSQGFGLLMTTLGFQDTELLSKGYGYRAVTRQGHNVVAEQENESALDMQTLTTTKNQGCAGRPF